MFSYPRQRRSGHGGCYSKVALPLVENGSILEQPLDLWALTEKYKSAALRIIRSARYNTAVNGKLIDQAVNLS